MSRMMCQAPSLAIALGCVCPRAVEDSRRIVSLLSSTTALVHRIGDPQHTHVPQSSHCSSDLCTTPGTAPDPREAGYAVSCAVRVSTAPQPRLPSIRM